jgi:hypothetical protein
MARHLPILFIACVALQVSGGVARAELVFLSSGRTLSVLNHRDDGDAVVLALRGGGEVTCDRSLISRIEADEVPYPEPARSTAERLGATSLPQVPYAEIIDQVSAAQGVDPSLARAVIQVESGYQASARSRKGAMGLMQLMPATARRLAVSNPYDPRANIEAGVRHLKSLLDRFELSVALAAYNAGEAAVKRFNGIPPYAETRSYVRDVLRLVRLAAQQ